MGHSDTADDACRADGTRPHAHLDRIHPRRNQVPGSFFGCDVARNNIHVRKSPLRFLHGFEYAGGVSVRGIDDDQIDSRADELGHTLQVVPCRADGRANAQPAVRVFGRKRVFDFLGDVLHRDQTFQVLIFIDDEEFFDPVLVQQALCFLQRCADRNRDEVLFCHDLANRQMEPRFEPEVAIRQDPHQPAVFRNRHPRDFVVRHQLEGVFDLVARRHCDRIYNHPAFGPFHLIHFSNLLVDRHIPVHDADPSMLGKGNRQARFRHRVHGGTDDRYVQFNSVCQFGICANFSG